VADEPHSLIAAPARRHSSCIRLPPSDPQIFYRRRPTQKPILETMKVELISDALCPFVHRASILLAEKGVPFERRNVDLKNKPDWFVALSPRGKVPVLIADGVALFESAAICEFLDETHPPPLIPSDPFERARQRGWVEVANDLLLTQYKLLAAASPAELEIASKALEPVLARLEAVLESGLIAATGFGLVHVALAPALHRFVVVEDRLGLGLLHDRPMLEALARRLAVRPSVARTVPDDFGARFVQIFVDRGSVLIGGRLRPEPSPRPPS
jgi:glutathione S-transferase